MQGNDLIEIKISKVIPAPKWRVIRLLTKVVDFPSFVPTVKETKVLKRQRNAVTTSWLIQVENVPIRWVEEDTIEPERNAIYFKAIEGDLPDLNGQWQFFDHPHGTEVTLTVQASIDIPIIKDFAKDHIKKIFTKNFEAILDAVEERLVSVRYSSYKDGNSKKVAGFGIIGHFYNFKHFERYLLKHNPEVKMPSQEFISQLFRIAHPFKAFDILDFRSKTGQTINGCFILATFFPDMLDQDPFGVFSKVVRSCKIAEKHGIGMVGLGGFSAIVGERIGHDISEELDIPVTTGRTLTASLVIEAVQKAAHLMDLDLSDSKIAIVGGTGNIGSAVARVFVRTAKHVCVTGRDRLKLNAVAAQLKKMKRTRISASLDNREAVKDADIVITATSAPHAILEIDWVKPGAILCDVGYPKNISYLSEPRSDILLFDGGLTQSPFPLSLPINIGLPSENVTYGCFAESIILGLEKRYENFSAPNRPISIEKIDEISMRGQKHGFVLADLSRNGKIIDALAIENVKRLRHGKRA
ncbi:MAG: SRPBCC family protein [Candidatus Omnitrophica bacterium]|nr:SRPBCC family protein [Candidatus Omnitrophota bacterium]